MENGVRENDVKSVFGRTKSRRSDKASLAPLSARRESFGELRIGLPSSRARRGTTDGRGN